MKKVVTIICVLLLFILGIFVGKYLPQDKERETDNNSSVIDTVEVQAKDVVENVYIEGVEIINGGIEIATFATMNDNVPFVSDESVNHSLSVSGIYASLKQSDNTEIPLDVLSGFNNVIVLEVQAIVYPRFKVDTYLLNETEYIDVVWKFKDGSKFAASYPYHKIIQKFAPYDVVGKVSIQKAKQKESTIDAEVLFQKNEDINFDMYVDDFVYDVSVNEAFTDDGRTVTYFTPIQKTVSMDLTQDNTCSFTLEMDETIEDFQKEANEKKLILHLQIQQEGNIHTFVIAVEYPLE